MTVRSATSSSSSTSSGPVRWDERIGAFVVTGFAEASAVLRGQGWSSDPANSPLSPPEMSDTPTGLMLFRDPPDHTRLRRLVAPAFSARAIEGLRPRVAAIVEACLDELEDLTGDGLTGDSVTGDGVEDVDLLADYGYLVPLAVIAELMDVGVEGAQVFLDETPQLVKMLEVDASPEDLADATAAAFEVTMFLTPILADRRGAGRGDDFISALLAQDELSIDEVLATCVLLLAAGHETTANLIGNGAWAVLADPGQRPHLLDNPARAVEEILRVHGPVKLIGRTAVADQEVGGVAVPSGSQVLILLDRAHRDPGRWADAESLDLSRPGPAHLGFGTGIHFCLGAALARMEGTEALVRLFTRYPRLELAEASPRWRTSSTFHGLERLVVRHG